MEFFTGSRLLDHFLKLLILLYKIVSNRKATIVLAEKRKVENMILLCLCLPLLEVLMVYEHEHEEKTICNIQLKGDTMTQNTCSATNSSELY